MPPVLFFVVAGVLPLTIFIDSLAGYWLKQDSNELLRRIIERPWEVKLLFMAVSLASAPMSFAISVQILRREGLGRSELRSVFLQQAYVWGTCCGIAVVMGMGVVMAGFLQHAPLWTLLTALAWISIAEERVAAKYVGESGWRTWALPVLQNIFSLLFMFAMMLVTTLGLAGIPIHRT